MSSKYVLDRKRRSKFLVANVFGIAHAVSSVLEHEKAGRLSFLRKPIIIEYLLPIMGKILKIYAL